MVKAEVLIRIPPYSNHYIDPYLPYRYQFMCAALHYAYWDTTGYKETAESRQGQLLEDVAALHYHRLFVTQFKGLLTYLYTKKDPGYCDFILKVSDERQIALEFGLGEKTIKQTQLSMKKVRCDYGLVFSNTPLSLNKKENIVTIPLKFFFLM